MVVVLDQDSVDPGPVTICHATHSYKNPYVVITVDESSIDELNNALANGHGDHIGPVFDVTLPKHTAWGDIIPAIHDFPGINTDAVAWIDNECRAPGETVYTDEATWEDELAICTADLENKTIRYSGWGTGSSRDSQDAATAAALEAAKAAADADLVAQLSDYPGYTEGTCPVNPPPTEYTGRASVAGDIAVCTAEATNAVVPFATGDVTRTSTVSQADADGLAEAAAKQAAPSARAAALSAYLDAHPGATEGACPETRPPTEPPTTPPPTPTEPETVAPVLPATVEEPETVSVPLPATVEEPANVPAGDGSSSTQVPSGAIALAGVGLVGLGASTAVILRRRVPAMGDTR